MHLPFIYVFCPKDIDTIPFNKIARETIVKDMSLASILANKYQSDHLNHLDINNEFLEKFYFEHFQKEDEVGKRYRTICLNIWTLHMFSKSLLKSNEKELANALDITMKRMMREQKFLKDVHQAVQEKNLEKLEELFSDFEQLSGPFMEEFLKSISAWFYRNEGTVKEFTVYSEVLDNPREMNAQN